MHRSRTPRTHTDVHRHADSQAYCQRDGVGGCDQHSPASERGRCLMHARAVGLRCPMARALGAYGRHVRQSACVGLAHRYRHMCTQTYNITHMYRQSERVALRCVACSPVLLLRHQRPPQVALFVIGAWMTRRSHGRLSKCTDVWRLSGIMSRRELICDVTELSYPTV